MIMVIIEQINECLHSGSAPHSEHDALLQGTEGIDRSLGNAHSLVPGKEPAGPFPGRLV